MTVPPDRDTVVLVPAAGRVPEGLVSLANIACPAMIPVAGRPVIHWTISYLRSLGLSRYRIGISRRGMFVEDFVDCSFRPECDVDFVVPDPGGLGDTVRSLVRDAKGSSALVVLGDTHFQLANADVLDRNEPFVLTSEVDESYRWCIAQTRDDGTISEFFDKVPELPEPRHALIGVYFFPDLERLREACEHAGATARAEGRRTEMSDILRKIAEDTPIRAIPAGDWLDVGNADRQAESHRTLLQKREFNELSIDPVLGTVTKRSRHVEKFVDEINYLRLLPPDLAVLFPRVLDFSTAWDAPHVTLEYYGYPSLSQVFVFENVDPGIWGQVFTHLHEILRTGFAKHTRPLAKGALRDMYLDKTRRRLDGMPGAPELLELVQRDGMVRINGREVPTLRTLWPKLEADVARLEQGGTFCVVHGDLCLSNILYDLRSRIVKLVDPRGSFGSTGIYGDQRYDVAKLYHSVYGLYDFIVSDLFDVKIDGADIRLVIRSRPDHEAIRHRFDSVFFPEFDRRDILLLTGLLFASMPALHYDAPRRQLAMYVRALELLGEAYGYGP